MNPEIIKSLLLCSVWALLQSKDNSFRLQTSSVVWFTNSSVQMDIRDSLTMPPTYGGNEFNSMSHDSVSLDSGMSLCEKDLSRTSTLIEPGLKDEITYDDLPKTPLRRRHLISDMNTLGIQFVATMVIFKQNLLQRVSRQVSLNKILQQRFCVVHLHTSPQTSIKDLYSSLVLEPSYHPSQIPVVLPVVEGVWELIVEDSYLKTIKKISHFGVPMRITEPLNLPPGIVARAAQVNATMASSGVDPVARSVPQIYVAMIQRYCWHRIMKDTAESLAAQRPASMIVNGVMYVF